MFHLCVKVFEFRVLAKPPLNSLTKKKSQLAQDTHARKLLFSPKVILESATQLISF